MDNKKDILSIFNWNVAALPTFSSQMKGDLNRILEAIKPFQEEQKRP